MIAGVGTDIVEVPRIAKAYERYGDAFLRRILSTGEFALARTYAESRRVEFTAGRFALKEAMAKASGLGLARLKMAFVDVRTTDRGLAVEFTASDHPLSATDVNWHLSISHTNDIAFAVAVLERP
ncbi:holo-ACP synthase [Alicyclobacillus ferrooxydans]|uniref:Holo-[acyl-carrier-protein] synthase n=1 Tax=Alicyclobacillus ferrooxydans TaxID=471514 RepID=A0A0P9GUP3_9BACL|nr:holo-ACP synthase [Alicyclobacillus ferrooxydans]KPV44986.1 hypothetical protein AN477_04235 [Alicyclobacillus ferrooxydans]